MPDISCIIKILFEQGQSPFGNPTGSVLAMTQAGNASEIVTGVTRTRTDIDNPLKHSSPAELVTAIEEFMDTDQLREMANLLRRGAQLARDSEASMLVPGLTEHQKASLQEENTAGVWQQPKLLWTAITTCAVAAILQYVFCQSKSTVESL